MRWKGHVLTAETVSLEETIRSEVDAERLQRHLEHFSTLFRDSGTEDERQAAAYLVRQLTDYGLSPETLTFRSYISWPRDGFLRVHNDDGTVLEAPTRTRSFGGSTPADGVTAELIFVPFAEPAKGEMIFSHRAVAGDYSGLDVAGKIVVTADGGPDGIRRAHEHGAIAHIHIWPSDEDAIHEMIATPIWGTPTTQTASRIPSIPALGIKHQDGNLLKERLNVGSLTVTVISNVETSWVDLPLVVADIPGTGSDTFLLVGSHIDSWYEGITDNATGDAALLEMARVLSGHREHLRHGVRFAWWPGHSTGRYSGSTWYADTHFMELRERALGYLNIDSPGSRGATIWDCRYNCGEIEALTASVVKELSGQEPNIRRPLKAGDQSFLGVGLPSLGAFRMLPIDHPDRKAVGGCGGGWWWHTPADTLDKADKTVLAEDTQVYVTMTLRMCVPELHPYDFVPVAEDFIARMEGYREAAGEHFDFEDAMTRAEAFRISALALREVAAGMGPGQTERFNTLHLRLSRALNPVLFTIAGPYEFDPALQMPVLPGLARTSELPTLAGSEYEFLKTELVRQRNRIADTLQTAVELIDEAIRQTQ
jgi:N-acetylated-alpha-linked acidic dipeptidase